MKLQAKATTITGYDNVVVMKYHNTSVVTLTDEAIELYTGGYETHTTKKRMNDFARSFNLGYYVYQKNFEWFVDYDEQTYKFENNTVRLERGSN